MQPIENIWIYENILLRDDDGRVYKPPGNSRLNRRVRNMPYLFSDLPFPILNRIPMDARFISSINRAFARIQFTQNLGSISHFQTENLTKTITIATFKEIYWNFSEMDNLPMPWKNKWENILHTTQIDWTLVWKNANDSLLNYKIQSATWMMTNLGFISSNRLNRIFGVSINCRQCGEPEESAAHCFLYCNVSNLVFDHFQIIITQLINRNITFSEKAFGILIEDFLTGKRPRLVNYLIAYIKSTVFRRRASINTLNVQSKSIIVINEIKKVIKSDLLSQFSLAKYKRKIPQFQSNFLIQDVFRKIQNRDLIFSEFLD